MSAARDLVAFRLDGKRVTAPARGMLTALELLRVHCGSTATRDGCGAGECGACTILVDGVPALSCLLLARELEGTHVTTIATTTDASVARMREAFLAETAFQCGFCTPGMILAASRIPGGASDDDVREALAGHACRCTGYTSIVRAVRRGLGND